MFMNRENLKTITMKVSITMLEDIQALSFKEGRFFNESESNSKI